MSKERMLIGKRNFCVLLKIYCTICFLCGFLFVGSGAYADSCNGFTLYWNDGNGTGEERVYESKSQLYRDRECKVIYSTERQYSRKGYTFIGFFESSIADATSSRQDCNYKFHISPDFSIYDGYNDSLYAAWAKNCSDSNVNCDVQPDNTSSWCYGVEYTTYCGSGYIELINPGTADAQCISEDNEKVIKLDKRGGSEGITYLFKYNNTRLATSYSCGKTSCLVSAPGSDTGIAISLPRKDHYKFGGYYTQPNGGGTAIIDTEGKAISATNDVGGLKMLFAKWVPEDNCSKGYFYDYDQDKCFSCGDIEKDGKTYQLTSNENLLDKEKACYVDNVNTSAEIRTDDRGTYTLGDDSGGMCTVEMLGAN